MANMKGRAWKAAAEGVHVSGWRWAISADGFGFVGGDENLRFSQIFFSVWTCGRKPPGSFAAAIKGSPAPCKSRLQMKWAHINVNSVLEKLFKVLLFTSTPGELVKPLPKKTSLWRSHGSIHLFSPSITLPSLCLVFSERAFRGAYEPGAMHTQ